MECSSFIPGWVDKVTATCGAFGSYSGVDTSACAPESCTLGQSINVTLGALKGQAALSEALAHSETDTLQCESVEEAMRGSLQLTCHFEQEHGALRACVVE